MKVEIDDNQFRSVLDRLPDAVVLLDHEGAIRYANPTALRIAQKTSLEVGKIFWDEAPVPVARALRAVFDRVLRGEETLVLRSYFAQGRWYELVAYPAGHEIALLGRDITEHLEAEAHRRLSEERFRILLEGVKDYAIVLVDPKGRISSWNAGAERLYGYRADEVLGSDASSFYPPEQGQRPRENLEAAVVHGHHEDEGWRVRKDGSRFFASASYYPLYDELGQPSGFAVVNRNVTEQRRMQQSLRTSEERLRLALDCAEMGSWDYRIERDQLFMDARCLDLVGLPPKPEPYTREEFIRRVHSADRERVREAQDQAHAGGSYHVEYRLTTESHRAERWLEALGNAVLDDSGKPIRVLGVVHDVSNRHRYEELSHLLPAIVAHDLRSPLATMKMATQTLLQSPTLPANTTRHAQTILRCTDLMAQMTSELLDFAQARFGGGLPLDRTPTDLADIGSDAVLAARIRCPECEFDFDVQGVCQGIWDRTRILEVVTNLLGNAMKHGSHAYPIGITVRGDGDHVTLSVHNVGPPIPSDLMPVLFDPFRRAERATSPQFGEKSYGLGLYIIREIVVAHGGTIDVRSSTESGTIFTIRLPRDASAVTAPGLSP
jgi:PAS domain S-box-containing protein